MNTETENSLVKTERELLEFLEVAQEPNANNIELLAYLRLVLYLGEIAPKKRSPFYLNTADTETPDSGTIVNAQSLSITNIGDKSGTITASGRTSPLPPGATAAWAAPGTDYLGNIGYDATNTRFIISYLT